MNEAQYKELNDYLNGCFMELEKTDLIFMDNLRTMAHLSDAIIKSFSDIQLVDEVKTNHLTFEDVYLLAREIINNIDEDYLAIYDKLIINGQLNFDYDYETGGSYYNRCENIINIARKFSYDDVIVLIHEFIHYTNGQGNLSHNRTFLTEFLSIYFEQYSKKYLIEKYKINEEEISHNHRLIDFLRANENFNSYCLVLLAFDELGPIGPNTQNDMQQILKINDSDFEKECLSTLDHLEKRKNQALFKKDEYINMANYFNKTYRYTIGTLLSFYALEYCKVEEVVRLNNQINSEQYANMNIYQVLETIGIETDEKFLNKSLGCLKKSITNSKVM